jgi:hypothetical protein
VVAWNDLTQYLVASMDATEKSPRLVELIISFDNSSPVTTFVSSAIGPSDKLWVSIDALVGPLDGIDLGMAARAVGEVVCGGLAHMPIQGADYLVVRHGMPVEDLPPSRIDDFLGPLYAASYGALSLKQRFGVASSTGGFNQL